MTSGRIKRRASDSRSYAEDLDTGSAKFLCLDNAVVIDSPVAHDLIPPFNQYYFIDKYKNRLTVSERFDLCLDPDSAIYGQPVPTDKFNEQLEIWLQKDAKFGLENSVCILWEDLNRLVGFSFTRLPFADAENTTLILRYEYLPANIRQYMDLDPPKAIMYKFGDSFVALPRQGWATFSCFESIELRVVTTIHDYVRTNVASGHQEAFHVASNDRRFAVTFVVS